MSESHSAWEAEIADLKAWKATREEIETYDHETLRKALGLPVPDNDGVYAASYFAGEIAALKAEIERLKGETHRRKREARVLRVLLREERDYEETEHGRFRLRVATYMRRMRKAEARVEEFEAEDA